MVGVNFSGSRQRSSALPPGDPSPRSGSLRWQPASYSPGGDPIAQAWGRLLDVHQARALSSRRSDPDRALSDGPNMVPVREMKSLLRTSMAFDKLAKA